MQRPRFLRTWDMELFRFCWCGKFRNWRALSLWWSRKSKGTSLEKKWGKWGASQLWVQLFILLCAEWAVWPEEGLLWSHDSGLQQYVKCELPDVQADFRKGRGTRDQTASLRWIIKKVREFQKNIYFCFTDYAKAFDCVDHNKLENSARDGNMRPCDLPPEKSVCRSRSNS